ncbi:MAG TPA: glycosyltransferase family 39 protein [Balneolaceae bacterium]|nr:glycosyltransferase family 39 protein [Balneolaceae bacterium]
MVTTRETIKKNLTPIYLALVGIVCAICYYYSFDPKVFIGGDNVYYYNLGKAIATGKGYVTLNQPGLPYASHYPPGYPAIIALVMTLFSQSIITIKIFNGIFLLGSAICSFYIFETLSENKHLAFAGSLLIVLNASMLKYSTIMMSEIPFLLFSMVALLLFIRAKKESNPLRQPYFYGFIVCLSIAFHIKTLGMALVSGTILYMLFYKRWKWAISTAAGFGLLALPWIIRNRMIGAGGSYVHQLLMVNPYRPELGMAGVSDFVLRFWNNLQRYIAVEIPNGILPVLKNNVTSYSFLAWVIGILMCLIIVYGLYRLKNYAVLMGAYFISMFGILLLWPSVWFGVRFLLPIIPLLLFCFLVGLHQLLSLASEKLGAVVHWSPLYLLLLGLTFIPSINARRMQAKAHYPANWGTYIQIAKWARKNTDPDAIISCRKPAIFYLFSERKTFRFKDTPNHEELFQDLKKRGTDYVVLDQLGFSSTPRYLYPMLKKYQNHFKTVLKGTTTQTYLLKFQPDSTNHE